MNEASNLFLKTIHEWLDYGYQQNWCSQVVCEMHEGAPRTSTEDEALDAGEVPCVYIVRVYESIDISKQIKASTNFYKEEK